MPRRQQLPEDLVKLARRNALSLRHESFRSDADRRLAAMEPILRLPAAPPRSLRPLDERDRERSIPPTSLRCRARCKCCSTTKV
jgi:hypothetical protein